MTGWPAGDRLDAAAVRRADRRAHGLECLEADDAARWYYGHALADGMITLVRTRVRANVPGPSFRFTTPVIPRCDHRRDGVAWPEYCDYCAAVGGAP